jgi:hypothetical protein
MSALQAARAALVAVSMCICVSPSLAEVNGGPVHAVLTVGAKPLAVEVTWYQSGGVVILKIVSDAPLPKSEQQVVLAAASTLLTGRTGGRAAIATTGQLMMGLQLTGWSRSFEAEDLEVGEAED